VNIVIGCDEKSKGKKNLRNVFIKETNAKLMGNFVFLSFRHNK